LREEKYDAVLSLFEKDRETLLGFDLPSPFAADVRNFWSSAGGVGAESGGGILIEPFELTIVWASEADRRVGDIGVTSKDRYYSSLLAHHLKRLVDAASIRAVPEHDAYCPTAPLPFTKTTHDSGSAGSSDWSATCTSARHWPHSACDKPKRRARPLAWLSG
jgi:hypothetical protein